MNPSGLTPEDIEANPGLGEAIVQATTAEHTLVCMIFSEHGAYNDGGRGESGVHHDRFEYDGRDWFVVHNDSSAVAGPDGFDIPPGKARLVVDGTNLAKLHEDETGWLYDPNSRQAMNSLSVHHRFAGADEEGHAAAATWLLRTVEALRWRVADVGGYDVNELASVETMLAESANRLQEVGV